MLDRTLIPCHPFGPESIGEIHGLRYIAINYFYFRLPGIVKRPSEPVKTGELNVD